MKRTVKRKSLEIEDDEVRRSERLDQMQVVWPLLVPSSLICFVQVSKPQVDEGSSGTVYSGRYVPSRKSLKKNISTASCTST